MLMMTMTNFIYIELFKTVLQVASQQGYKTEDET